MASMLLFVGCGSKQEEAATQEAETSAEETVEEAVTDTEEADAVEETGEAASEGTEKAEGDTFIVGFDAEYPPYGYLDDATGEYTGFDLELAQEVADRNGWELVKQPIDWDSKDMEINSGNIDCIWNGFTMTGREDEYTWSEPYLNNSQIFLVRADGDIASLDDLAGKVVIVQAGSAAAELLAGDQQELAATFGQLDEVPDYNTAVMNLEAGACDAVAIDKAIAAGYTKDGKVKELGESISEEEYAIGFKLGNTALRDQVQATFDEMIEDGTVLKIAEKYAEDNIPDALIRK